MKTEDFIKTKEELENKIKKNNEIINLSDERMRMAKANQFDNKFGISAGCSMVPYFGLFMLSTILSSTGTMSSITNTIPVEVIPLIISGGSMGLGNLGRKILERKYKIKERFKSFSNAKTQYEKMAEEIKYTIELEKAKNRNEAIQETIDSLNSTQSILCSLPTRDDISDKNIPQTMEESKKRIDELSMLLNEKYSELDVLSTKKVLHEKFWKVRTDGYSSMDTMTASIIGGIFTMVYVDIPLIFMDLNNTISYSSIPSGLLISLAPIVLGALSVGGYMIRRNKNYKRIFNDINNDLNKNALKESIKDPEKEEHDIYDKIESKIREISITESRLQEQKRIMESMLNNSVVGRKELSSSVSKEYMINESKTVLEPQIEEKGPKGPSLTLRKKIK